MTTPKTITLPTWSIGLAMTIVAAVVSISTSRVIADKHIEDVTVHTNRELVEFRLGTIESRLGNIESLLEGIAATR